MLTGLPCWEQLACDETLPCSDGPVAVPVRLYGGVIYCSDSDVALRCSDNDITIRCADGLRAIAA
jgi:hypothetical protein